MIRRILPGTVLFVSSIFIASAQHASKSYNAPVTDANSRASTTLLKVRWSRGADYGNGITGHWETYPITQRSVDGMFLAARTFQATIDFSPEGMYDLLVQQSESPRWVLAVHGRYEIGHPAYQTRDRMGYPMVIRMVPSDMLFNGSRSPMPGSEKLRLTFEGFPGPDAEDFGLRAAGSGQIEIKGRSNLVLKR